MSDTFKIIDIYGTPFSFTIFGGPLYKTNCGGLITTLTLISFVISFLYFGQDFYLRRKPKLLDDGTTRFEYSNFGISNDNFFIAVNYQLLNGAPFNATGHLNLSLTYTKAKGSKVDETTLLGMSCNNYNTTNLQLTYNLTKLAGITCFNLTNLDLGGYFGNTWVNYLSLTVSNCINSSNVKNCLERNNSVTFMNQNPVTVNLYTNNIYTNFSDVDYPLKLGLQNINSRLDTGMGNKIRIFYKDGTSSLDKALLTSLPINNTLLGYDTAIFSTSLINKENYEKPDFSFIKYEFFYGLNSRRIEVTYIKLQEVFANIGGILNLINIFFGTIARFLNEHNKTLSIINQVFDFNAFKNEDQITNIIEIKEKKKLEKKQIILEKKKTIRTPVINNIEFSNLGCDNTNKILQDKSLLEGKSLKLEVQNSNLKDKSDMEEGKTIKLDIDVGNSPDKSNEFFNKINDEQNNILAVKEDVPLDKIIDVSKLFNEKITYFDMSILLKFKSIICGNSLDKKERFYSKLFEKAENIIRDKMDFMSYLEFMDEFSFLKSILLGHIHSLCLGYIEKPKLYEKNNFNLIFSSDEKKINEIVQYFRGLEKFTKRDEEFFNLISPYIKNLVKL